jgi:phenylpropionate dioxygenase-like ring-hydroxylating dioxygenase large terminal subunit
MIERSHWHPVARVEDVGAHPVGAQLLGEQLVLWRDAKGESHVWADRCPHRGAKLSMGQVLGGRLECPYHGWQFNANAACVQVPAQPEWVPPASHCAKAFGACEAHGLIWAKLDNDSDPVSANAGLPIEQRLPAFAAESDPNLRKMLCGPYQVATSAPRIVENFLDMAHFGFVHDAWLGSREANVIAGYEVTNTPTGPQATNCKAVQPRSNLLSKAASEVAYTYAVTGPYSAVLTKQVAPWRESIALYVCPLQPENSLVWFRLAVADFAAPEQDFRAFQDTIFQQDKPVLESQSPKRLPLDLQAERHGPADRLSSAYRRHLSMLGVQFGVC